MMIFSLNRFSVIVQARTQNFIVRGASERRNPSISGVIAIGKF